MRRGAKNAEVYRILMEKKSIVMRVELQRWLRGDGD